MPDMVYMLATASSGSNICELPLTVTSPIQFGYSAVGQWSASLPASHPAASRANFEDVVEVTCYRDGQAEMNGPVGEVDVSSDGRTVDLTIYEASAYFGLRTVEVNKHYNADRWSIVRKLFTEITTKLSTAGDGTASPGLTINADLPRFSVMAGLSGFTMPLALSGIARHTFAECLEKLQDDPTEGLEWCMDYHTSSTRQQAHRKLLLGTASNPLGSTLGYDLTAGDLYSYGKTDDVLTSGTRWHARGAGATETRQNTGSITAGTLLLEQVLDRGDVSDTTALGNAAREGRRKGQVPVKMPRLSVPFGVVGIGDVLPLNVDDPYADLLTLSAQSRRCVGSEWIPESGDNPEIVNAVLNLPLSSLGT